MYAHTRTHTHTHAHTRKHTLRVSRSDRGSIVQLLNRISQYHVLSWDIVLWNNNNTNYFALIYQGLTSIFTVHTLLFVHLYEKILGKSSQSFWKFFKMNQILCSHYRCWRTTQGSGELWSPLSLQNVILPVIPQPSLQLITYLHTWPHHPLFPTRTRPSTHPSALGTFPPTSTTSIISHPCTMKVRAYDHRLILLSTLLLLCQVKSHYSPHLFQYHSQSC